MSNKKNDDLKNVVVVGGGFAGSTIAKTLSATLDKTKYNLILITSRPYFIHIVAGIRMNVTDEGHLENTALIPYDKLFLKGIGSHIVGTVISIEEESPGHGVLVLKDGEKVEYDALVLATGSNWSGPLNFPESDADIRASIQDWRKKYAGAKEIALVGGGAVGIEMAGEIRDTFPDKKVTIIHGGDLLLNDVYPVKFRKDIERRVRARNIDIILGDYVDSIPEPGTAGVTTRNGQSLSTVDLVVPTWGGKPNTKFVQSLGSDVLTPQGNVKVNPTLEVVGHSGIFAAGDIIDWKEQKQAGKAPTHAGVVAANVLSYLAGKPLAKQYKGSFEGIVIPVGKNGGGGYFGILWGILLGNWVTRTLKGKHLFVSMSRGNLGYQ